MLRLSALAPAALALFAKDKIGMEAAQALTLTDDHDRQIEALNRCGNSGHPIRRMLTDTKIGTGHALFRFVGSDAYAAAGGTVTRDLFATEGDGYADDPALVAALATGKLDELAIGYRAEGWQDVRSTLKRPDDYCSVVNIHAAGSREPTAPSVPHPLEAIYTRASKVAGTHFAVLDRHTTISGFSNPRRRKCKL